MFTASRLRWLPPISLHLPSWTEFQVPNFQAGGHLTSYSSHCRLKALGLSRNLSCSSLYTLCTDRTENTASNSSSFVACVCYGHHLARSVLYRGIT
jgi:hypothetical protein